MLVDLPFVGRDVELATLADRIGDGRSTLVTGGAGSGKTRLVRSASAQLGDDWIVLSGRASDDTTNAALGPFREIASRAGRHLDPSTLGLASRSLASLATLFTFLDLDPTEATTQVTTPADGDSSRHELRLNFLRYLELLRTRTKRPVLLVVEDAHWADSETLLMLRWLLDRDDGVPCLVTTRDPVPEVLDRLPRLHLGPIGEDAVGEALAALGRSDEPAQVLQATGGIPLRLHHWCLGADRNAAMDSAGVIAGLDPSTQTLLRPIAVAGRRIDRALAASVTERDPLDLDSGLVAAIEHGVLLQTATHYGFSHDSYREVLLESVGSAERARLHRLVLNELESRSPTDAATLSLLAHHATQAAADGDRSAAVQANLRSGRVARSTGSLDSARENFEIALELAQMDGDAERVLECRFELALTLVAASDPAADSVLSQVYTDADRLGDAVTYARAALAQPSSLGAVGISFLGDVAAARRLAGAQRRLAPDHPLQSRLSAGLAVQQHATLTEADYFAHVRRAEQIAAQIGDDELETVTFLARHSIRRPVGTLSTIRHEVDRLIADRSPADPYYLPLHDLAVVAAMRDGDLAGADRMLLRLQTELDPGPPVAQWTILRCSAALEHARGNVERFEGLALEALSQANGTRYSDAAGTYFGFQVATLMRERRLLEDAVPAVEAWVGEHPGYTAFRAARSWLCADRGDLTGARRDLDFVFAQDLPEFVTRVEGLLLVSMATAAVATVGDARLAGEAYELMAPFAAEWIVIGGGTVIDGPTLRPMALASATIGETDRALDEIDEAIERTKSAGAELIETTCLRDRAFVLRSAGDYSGARDQFLVAADRYAEHGLEQWAQDLRGQAAELDTMAPAAVPAPERTSAREPGLRAVLRREGTSWRVCFGNEEGLVGDLKGLALVEVLVRNPGRTFWSSELAHIVDHGTMPAEEPGQATSVGADGRQDDLQIGTGRHRVLDGAAMAAYRERIEAIDVELDRADRRGDVERSERLGAELDALTEELRRATAMGGRSRAFTDADERARVRIRKLIGTAVRRIDDVSPSLADHLERCLRTGASCSYEPNPRAPVHWG